MTLRAKLTITAIALGSCGAAIATANFWLTALARRWVPALLSEKFDSDVEIGSLRVSAFPPAVYGEHLVFRKRGRRDVPPLITLASFSARTTLLALVRAPRHVRSVRLDGLHIQVPPENERIHDAQPAAPGRQPRKTPAVVDELVSTDARLDILPSEAGKVPLTFLIHRLEMQHVATDRPAPFRAVLTNPKPEGKIETQGQFGPWNPGHPGLTPVSGGYEFKHADLNTIRGISGILSSKGRFAGILEKIEVDGSTETPDFSVDIAGHKVPLHTDFHAVVDGTNGNTFLRPVKARFLNASVLAEGAVVDAGEGRRTTLDVTVRDAPVEDLLKLALKGDTPLTGRVGFRTRFDLPPGEGTIAERLRLDGEFGIFDSQFTKLDVREKVAALSRRGEGEPDNPQAGSTVSNFRGRFSLKNGVVAFPDLRFSVAGAAVYLSGTYGLESEELGFRGNLRLDATVSQTTTGIKSALLKLVDPLFKKKGAGAVIPIKIEGTRSHPKFGLDTGRVFK